MADNFHIKHWLDLSLADGVGPKIFRRLLAAFDTPREALRAPLAELKHHCNDKTARAVKDNNRSKRVAQIIKWTAENQCHLITLADAAYPPALLEIPDPPPLLYARGDLSLLPEKKKKIAVVGSRNASAVGIKNTEIFARALSEHNICVVSGMAQGVDFAAHTGALQGATGTIAVVGTGIDIIYPKANRKLAEAIVSDGLMLSEFALGTEPIAANFPRRNRIISGLADACLVTEAGLNSGSLITAEFAVEQGREVFAVPGSINAPNSRGCHRLIRQGAKLVENVFDILEDLNINAAPLPRLFTAEDAGGDDTDDGEDGSLLKHIDYEPTSVDDIAARSGLSAQELMPELLNLEMIGKITAATGGRYQRT